MTVAAIVLPSSYRGIDDREAVISVVSPIFYDGLLDDGISFTRKFEFV